MSSNSCPCRWRFLVLGVLQENHIRRLRFRARAIAFFERGLARIEGRWAGSGETGERFLNPRILMRAISTCSAGHRLFELLCTARTRAGEETLAAWLLAAAPVDEVLARQEAVRELKAAWVSAPSCFRLGETVRLGVHPEALAAWGERKPAFPRLLTRVLTRTLCGAVDCEPDSWALGAPGDVAAAITIFNLAWAHRLYRRLDEAADSLEKAADGLALLSGVLSLLERRNSPRPSLLSCKPLSSAMGLRPRRR
jgi:hypothetical protein